ncbi:hypothetical protein PFICI_11931 [Pestalotiopsis fici W106-1]|uniref:Zn(2)-C6 fungal-type domain-containing protein n=1 Tax=Pestalotiopsis fici (strain W106-1 / CGMCC3.15140) TaxID=1229662 RepID=W3WRT5_PESFW|nr:uncharacterized protein PFICI_11931 [Pestalotiopsis fici W106-1]ETS76544.1 hypothetical protein PFICI_11931 [Pestalotiopsis fici W106-1]
MGVSPAGSSIPPSRQKNCHNCVQTKRRCDRRMPHCSRCVERNIPCDYSRTRTAIQADRQARRDNANGPASISHPLFSPGPAAEMDYLGSIDADMVADLMPDYPAEPLLQSPIDATHGIDVLMDNQVDLMGGNTPASMSQWLVAFEDDSITERPSTPVDEEITRSYQKMAPMCDNINTWSLHDPSTPLYYITSRVKNFVNDMATHNATPFLHPFLYRAHTPECIMSCFSTSVLYTARTPTNTAMVMRALCKSAHELVAAESVRFVTTTTERLARAQALLLYQIIRLFDGDVALRAQAERDSALLNTWLAELCKMRDNLSTSARLENSVARAQPPEWEQWIFAESVRRTILMAYSVLGLYELMKDPEWDGEPNPWAYTHRWTLSRSLWEAKSSAGFQRAWKEKPQFVMENHSFERFLEHGRGSDVDEFAEILLNVYMGVDETKEFLSSRETPVPVQSA